MLLLLWFTKTCTNRYDILGSRYCDAVEMLIALYLFCCQLSHTPLQPIPEHLISWSSFILCDI